jgi:predicted RNase H-like HicB family nuclease
MTHQSRTYSLVIEPDEEGGYLAFFPALRGFHSWGDTYEEAAKNAEEVLLGYREALRKNGEEIPFEEYSSGEISLGVLVNLPAGV